MPYLLQFYLRKTILTVAALLLSHLPAEALDRNSREYRDLRARLDSFSRSNPVSFHMLSGAARDGEVASADYISILSDHSARISAAEHFKSGRGTWVFKLDGSADLKSSRLVQRYLGAGGQVGIKVGAEIIRSSGTLVPVSGAIAAETGQSLILNDSVVTQQYCGSPSGNAEIPLSRVGSIEANVSGSVCYKYEPNTFTPLGAYVAKYQSEIAATKFGANGARLDQVTDKLYEYATANCGPATYDPSHICGTFHDLIGALNGAGFALQLPRSLRTEQEIREAVRENDEVRVILDTIDENGEKRALAEERLGRKLSDIDAAIFLLLEDSADQPAFSDELIDAFDDPRIRAKLTGMMANAVYSALRATQRKPWEYPERPETEEERLLKFSDDLKSIHAEHDNIQAFGTAAKNVAQLIAVVTGDDGLARDAERLAKALHAANELARATRVIQKAIELDQVASTASLAATGNAAAASLTLLSLFSENGGPSELEIVMDYLERQFEVVNLKLDTLLDSAALTQEKLDTLIRGQAAILSVVRSNSLMIGETQAQIAVVRRSLDELSRSVFLLSQDIDLGFKDASKERLVLFEEQRNWTQRERLIRAAEVLDFWLNPDSQVIEKLNSGSFDNDYIDNLRNQRQVVLTAIDATSAGAFVRSAAVVALDQDAEKRPPASNMSRLIEMALEVNRVAEYARKRTSIQAYGRMSGLGSYYDPDAEQEKELERFHKDAFRLVEAERFSTLSNPDALLFLVERYYLFYLALSPEARSEIGFADIPNIQSRISKLVDSSREARSAAYTIMGQLPETFYHLSEKFDDINSGGRLFRSRTEELSNYVFGAEAIRDRKEIESTEKAVTFAKEISRTPDHLEVILQRSGAYLELGGFGSQRLANDVVAVIQRISDDPSKWMLPGASDEWNLFVLSWLQALHFAHLDGELFEFSESELYFLKAFFRSTPTQLSEGDIRMFVSLIKSDLQLLRFAENEGWIDYRVVPSDGVADVFMDDPAQRRVYATVQHEYYATYNLKYGSFNFPYPCSGVRMVIEPWAQDFPIARHTRIAFPVKDDQGGLRVPNNEFADWATIGCISLARELGWWIEHPIGYIDDRLSGSVTNGVAHDSSLDRRGDFDPALSMLESGTELWHRGRVRCVRQAIWSEKNEPLEGLNGVNLNQPLTTVMQYVEETLDNPRKFSSPHNVNETNQNLVASDGTPLSGNFLVACAYNGQSAEFDAHPHPDGPVAQGQQKFPIVIGRTWTETLVKDQIADLSQTKIRDAVTSILLQRLDGVNERQNERLGYAVTLEHDIPRYVYRKIVNGYFHWKAMSLRELDYLAASEDQDEFRSHPAYDLSGADDLHNRTRDELISHMRDWIAAQDGHDTREALVLDRFIADVRGQGLSAVERHPFYAIYLEVDPETAQWVQTLTQYAPTIAKQPSMLKMFAEWGFGACFYALPELRIWAELVYGQHPETQLNSIEAMTILSQNGDGNVGDFPIAAYTLSELYAQFERRRTSTVNDPALSFSYEEKMPFPPRPRLADRSSRHLVPSNYPGIDHNEADASIAALGCETGLPAIVELARWSELVEDALQ